MNNHHYWTWRLETYSQRKNTIETNYWRTADAGAILSCTGSREKMQRNSEKCHISETAVPTRRRWSTNPCLWWDTTVFPTSLGKQIMYLPHYSGHVGNPRERWMYDTMRQHYYRLHMANEVYNTLLHCQPCSGDSGQRAHQRKLQLFQPAEPLQFMAMHILRALPKTSDGNQFIIVVADRYLNWQ